MDEQTLRSAVFDALRHIAPEIKPDELEPGTPLRDQVDLDSMDWLNVLLGLHQRFGVEIPESDYRRLGTLAQIVEYLAGRSPAP